MCHEADLSLFVRTDFAAYFSGGKTCQASAHEQFGPDPWIEALFQLEAVAQVAMQLKLTDFAEESARILAKHDANYPGTHYALAQVAALKHDAVTDEREIQLARQGWSKADGKFLAQNFSK